jgi:hypothetical protein
MLVLVMLMLVMFDRWRHHQLVHHRRVTAIVAGRVIAATTIAALIKPHQFFHAASKSIQSFVDTAFLDGTADIEPRARTAPRTIAVTARRSRADGTSGLAPTISRHCVSGCQNADSNGQQACGERFFERLRGQHKSVLENRIEIHVRRHAMPLDIGRQNPND